MQSFQTEQSIRTLVDEQLKNLGWNLSGGKECNVFQEQPRTSEEKSKLKGMRPDYVLYASDTNRKEPLGIIETKKPGANLDKALWQAENYAIRLGAPIVFATDGVYYKSYHTKKQAPLFLNGEEVDELIRELDALKYLKDNRLDTISSKVIYDRRKLIRIFEDSNDLLRDEGFRAGIERFGEFSNILFLKLIGELEDLKESEGRNNEIVLEKYLRWSQWKNKTGGELLDFVNMTVLPKIGNAYKDDDIFTPLKIQNPSTLRKIIDHLDPLNLINIDSDIKGDAFEYFLKQSTATKNDLGEYFTPRHIIKVMVKLINPRIGEQIYDPFCGTGGTLIESFRHISHNMARTKLNWKLLRDKTLFGNEITSTARITKMNMILIGDGHSGIKQKNSLSNPINNEFDIVITNMPYSQKTDYGSLYDIPSTNGDSICVQHCIKAINKSSENGRMALVVPEGFLFRKDLQKTREYLLDRSELKSIISLPQGVFLPYTGVKTNIIYCTGIKKKKKWNKFWYFDVKNDGYSLDNHRRKLDGKTDLQVFLEYRNPEQHNQNDTLKIGFQQISKEDVEENNLVLVGNQYNKIFDYKNIEWRLSKLSELSKIIRGVTYSKKDETENVTKNGILRANNIDLESNALNFAKLKYLKENVKIDRDKKLTSNDILVCTSSGSKKHLGKFALIKSDIDFFAGGFMSIIRPDTENLRPKFLFFILTSRVYRQYVQNTTKGSNINNLKNSDLENFKLPLPPLTIQDEIIKEIDRSHTIIKSCRKIVNTYIPKIELNEKWEYIKLVELSDIIMGQSPKGKHYNLNGQGLPFYQGKTDFGEIYLKTPTKWTTNTPKEARKGDVLLSVRAPVGPVNISPDRICIGRGLCAIRPKKQLNKFFLFYYLKNIEKEISKLSTGSTFSAIKKIDVENILVPIPSHDEQTEIVEQLESEMDIVQTNKNAIELFEKRIQDKLDYIWGK